MFLFKVGLLSFVTLLSQIELTSDSFIADKESSRYNYSLNAETHIGQSDHIIDSKMIKVLLDLSSMTFAVKFNNFDGSTSLRPVTDYNLHNNVLQKIARDNPNLNFQPVNISSTSGWYDGIWIAQDPTRVIRIIYQPKEIMLMYSTVGFNIRESFDSFFEKLKIHASSEEGFYITGSPRSGYSYRVTVFSEGIVFETDFAWQVAMKNGRLVSLVTALNNQV